MPATIYRRSNQRIKTTLVALICALVFAGSMVIGIFAATQQNVTSNFSVVYEVGENVAVKVRTESYVPNMPSNNLTVATKDKNNNTITDGDGYVIFNAPDSYSEKEVIIPDVALTPDYPKVEFLYTITNLNEAGYVQYDLINELSEDPAVTYNVKSYVYYNVSDTLDSTQSATTYESNTWEEDNLLNLPAGKTTAVKFVVEVDDPNQIAAAAGKFGFQLIYTANDTREAGTVNRESFIEQTASTSAVVFDEYSSPTAATYSGVNLGTGTDISMEQNGTVNLYNVGNTTYVLSHEPIMFPEDSSYMFATNVSGVGSMSVRPMAARTPKASITLRNINTTKVKNMSNMFAGATVTELDLSAFNPVRVRNMSSMFKNCTNLTKVYIDGVWQTETVTSSKDMFAGCTSLPNYSVDATDKTNATNGGYLTEKVQSEIGTLSKALWTSNNNGVTQVYFDKYTSTSSKEYKVNGTNIISGVTAIDISEERNGAVALYKVGSAAYILSHKAINFPVDSSSLFSNMNLLTIEFDNINTENTENIEDMFNCCHDLVSVDLSSFDTSNVTDMSGLFFECGSLTSVNLTSFDTSNVTDISCMFYYCSSLRLVDLSSFDTSSVTVLAYMFVDCVNLSTIYVSYNWGINSSAYGVSMFTGCVKLPGFSSNYTGQEKAHAQGGYLTNKYEIVGGLDRSAWIQLKTSNSTSIQSVITSIYFDVYTGLDSYVVDGVNLIEGITGVDISMGKCGTIKAYINGTRLYVLAYGQIAFPEDSMGLFCMRNLEYLSIKNVDTSYVTNMMDFFASAYKLTTLDLTSFDTKNVTNMENMFYGCESLTNIYVSGKWSTKSLTKSTWMFYGCTKLPNFDENVIDKTNAHTGTGGYLTARMEIDGTFDMSKWMETCPQTVTEIYFDKYTSETAEQYYAFGTNVISGVTGIDVSQEQNGSIMLYNVGTKVYVLSHSKIKFGQSLMSAFSYMNATTIKLKNIDSSKVTDMSFMFSDCRALTNLDISELNTSRATNMVGMFSYCISLTSLNLTNFNTSKVEQMNGMFADCAALVSVDISSFNTKSLKYLYSMFITCSNLTTIYIGTDWNVSSAGGDYMFDGCVKLPNFDSSQLGTSKAHAGSGGYMQYK